MQPPEIGTTRQEWVNAYFESCASYWNDVYSAEDIEATIYRERRSSVLEFADRLHLLPGSPVLEIGCGAGYTTVDLARKGLSIHAVDSVQTMISRTRQAVDEAGVADRVGVQLGDVHSLEFSSDTFDLVVAVGVLPWVDSLYQPLREMTRVTKPGGHLILTADNAWRLCHIFDPKCFPLFRPYRRKIRNALDRIGVLNTHPPQPRHNLFSIKKFDQIINATGLSKICAKTLGFGPFTFLGYHLFSRGVEIKIHEFLQDLADKGFFALRSTGTEYVVLCQKPVETRVRQ